METSIPEDYHPGQIVYVMYRNPHSQSITKIEEASIVNDPYQPNQLALCIFDTFYPISKEIAIYRTREEAEQAYQDYFG